MPESLYSQAVALGWKLLPSYGLTECSSQVATTELSRAGEAASPPLRLLSHVEVRLAPNGCLEIRSRSLLTCYACKKNENLQIDDPKKEGWLTTEDRGVVKEAHLQIFGRSSTFIKIGGESCDLLRLEHILEELKLAHQIASDMALVPVEDARLGHVIHLAAIPTPAIVPLVEAFQKRVLPFERIRHIHYLESLPRTALSKLKMDELKQLILGSDLAVGSGLTS